MATIDSMTQTGVSVEVEPTFKAMRVTNRPLEYISYGAGGQTRVLGHYSIIAQAGAAAAWTAAGNLLFFKYTDPSSVAVILRFTATVVITTAVTTQQQLTEGQLQLVRGVTQNYTTNASVMAAAGARARNNMAQTPNLQFQNATAAAGMTGGNGTTESAVGMLPINFNLQHTVIGASTPETDIYKYEPGGKHPVVLAQNEGLNLQWYNNTLASGAAAVWCRVEWAEVPEF